MRHSIFPQVGSYVIDCCSEASCSLQPMCPNNNVVGTGTPEVTLAKLSRRVIKADVDFGPMSKTRHSHSDHRLDQRPGKGVHRGTVGVVVVAEAPWPNGPNRGVS